MAKRLENQPAWHHLDNFLTYCSSFLAFREQCSSSCNGGSQTRTAECVDELERVVDPKQCNESEKIVIRSCGNGDCPHWDVGSWTPVSWWSQFIFFNYEEKSLKRSANAFFSTSLAHMSCKLNTRVWSSMLHVSVSVGGEEKRGSCFDCW